jgi:hypothetical protein
MAFKSSPIITQQSRINDIETRQAGLSQAFSNALVYINSCKEDQERLAKTVVTSISNSRVAVKTLLESEKLNDFSTSVSKFLTETTQSHKNISTILNRFLNINSNSLKTQINFNEYNVKLTSDLKRMVDLSNTLTAGTTVVASFTARNQVQQLVVQNALEIYFLMDALTLLTPKPGWVDTWNYYRSLFLEHYIKFADQYETILGPNANTKMWTFVNNQYIKSNMGAYDNKWNVINALNKIIYNIGEIYNEILSSTLNVAKFANTPLTLNYNGGYPTSDTKTYKVKNYLGFPGKGGNERGSCQGFFGNGGSNVEEINYNELMNIDKKLVVCDSNVVLVQSGDSVSIDYQNPRKDYPLNNFNGKEGSSASIDRYPKKIGYWV